MPLLSVILVLICVGVILYVVNAFIPMEASIKKILNIVVVIATIFWLLSLFGLFGNLSAIHVGR